MEPCFPPSYGVFGLHVEEYKAVLQQKIDAMLAGQQMDSLLTQDPDSILDFSAFAQSSQAVLADLQHPDDFFLNLQIVRVCKSSCSALRSSTRGSSSTLRARFSLGLRVFGRLSRLRRQNN